MLKYFISFTAMFQFAYAGPVEEKLISKGEKFIETLSKEVKINDLIKAQNATYPAGSKRDSVTAPADIAQKDAQWIKWKKEGGAPADFIKAVTTGQCANVIQALTARMSYITEVFIMDKMGANVCAYPATSDYDQGDEPKWQGPFNKGENPQVGKIDTDESTGVNQAQVSYLIQEGANKLGTITIGIKSK